MSGTSRNGKTPGDLDAAILEEVANAGQPIARLFPETLLDVEPFHAVVEAPVSLDPLASRALSLAEQKWGVECLDAIKAEFSRTSAAAVMAYIKNTYHRTFNELSMKNSCSRWQSYRRAGT
jgi:hypothetical protein